jgi:hypothetical protein
MKNIHVVSTDKPSRLSILNSGKLNFGAEAMSSSNSKHTQYYLEFGLKIILTTDQDLIKDGVQAIDDEFLEWFVKNPSCEEVEVRYTVDFNSKAVIIIPKEEPKQKYEYIGECKGNNDDGCFMNSSGHNCGCFIRVPKEEPKQETENLKNFKKLVSDEISPAMKDFIKEKQETLKEFANKAYPFYGDVELREAIELGAKWQAERMYSEKEARAIWEAGQEYWKTSGASITFEELTEQFKKK